MALPGQRVLTHFKQSLLGKLNPIKKWMQQVLSHKSKNIISHNVVKSLRGAKFPVVAQIGSSNYYCRIIKIIHYEES